MAQSLRVPLRRWLWGGWFVYEQGVLGECLLSVGTDYPLRDSLPGLAGSQVSKRHNIEIKDMVNTESTFFGGVVGDGISFWRTSRTSRAAEIVTRTGEAFFPGENLCRRM